MSALALAILLLAILSMQAATYRQATIARYAAEAAALGVEALIQSHAAREADPPPGRRAL